MVTYLIITLLLAGILAGLINLFITYLELPFHNNSTAFLEDEDGWPRPKKLWIAVLGYLLVGIAGAFLTPLLDALIGLKGYNTNKDFLIVFGYGVVFGYSTNKLLVGLLASIIKRLSEIDERLLKVEKKSDRYNEAEYNKCMPFLIARPKWNKVYEGYPKTGDGSDDMPTRDVFSSILGSIDDPVKFDNACATRVSLGLLNSGVEVKKDFLVQIGQFKGKGFIASAQGLKEWLSNSLIFGKPDIVIQNPSNLTEVKNKINSKNGIYIVLGGFHNVSGHATLWLGNKKDVIGGHNYVSNSGIIYFWELL